MHIVRDIIVNDKSKNFENMKQTELSKSPELNNFMNHNQFLNFILNSKINYFENSFFEIVKKNKKEELIENANYLFVDLNEHQKFLFFKFINKVYDEMPEMGKEKNLSDCILENFEEKFQNIFYEQKQFEHLELNNLQNAYLPLKESKIHTALLNAINNDLKINPFCKKQEFLKEKKNIINENFENQLLHDVRDSMNFQSFFKIIDDNFIIAKNIHSSDDSFYNKIHNYYKNFSFKNDLKSNNLFNHEKNINNENNNEFRGVCHLNNNLNFKNLNYENLNLNKFNNCVFYGDFAKFYENDKNYNQTLINLNFKNNIPNNESDIRNSILNKNDFQFNNLKKDFLIENIQENLDKNWTLLQLNNSEEEKEKFLGQKIKKDREIDKNKNKALFHTRNINNQIDLQKKEFKNKLADSYLNKKTLKNNKFVYIIKNNKFFKKAFSNCNNKIIKNYSEIVTKKDNYDNLNCKENLRSDLVDIPYRKDKKEDSNDTITGNNIV